MSEIRILTLGRTRITRDGQGIGDGLTAKALALLIYLAVTGTPHSREHLAALFWGDMSETVAQTNLRQALSKLRRLLEPYLLLDKQEVQFNTAAPHWLDVAHIAERKPYAADPEEPAIRELQSVLGHYHGDFLTTLTVKNAPDFEAWVIEQRERFRLLASEKFRTLVDYELNVGEPEAALQALDTWLKLDPWNEAAHRIRMLLLARRGEKLQALARYQEVQRILGDEFGIEPSSETTALAERIRAGKPIAAPLPVFPTKFVGRESERAALERLLSQPLTRLVTLLGPGGMGKTRLALEIASAQRDRFLHGVAFVSLQEVTEPAQLAFAVGAAVHFSVGSLADPIAQLGEFFRDKDLLLLLDNFEQVTASASVVARWLQEAPDLKILVTSRERLALQAEHVYELRGMGQDAILLFAARARQLQFEFETNESNRAAIARIAQLVGGMPLALELAAGLVRASDCEHIAAQLERSPIELESKARDIPAHHRSLRAVLEESWEALSQPERAVVTRLAVFHGGFDSRAAQEIAGASPAVLGSLSDKAFLERRDDRFELHPVMREFALERLEDGERATRRHAEYFLNLLKAQRERITGGTQAQALKELGAEIANLRAAWQWAVRNGEREPIDAGAPVLFRYLEASSQFRQAQELFEPAANVSHVPRAYYGAVLYFMHSLDAAARELERAAEHASAAEDMTTLRFCRLHLGNVALDRGEFAAARQLYEQALSFARQWNDLYLQVDVLNNLGMAAVYQGEFEAARTFLNECIEIAAQIGETRGIAGARLNLGMVDGNLGAYDAARAEFELALPLFQAVGDRRGISVVLGNLGEIALVEKRLDDAEKSYRECLETYQDLALAERAANMRRSLGNVALERGDAAEAQRLYKQALAEYRRIGARHGECFALCGLGKQALARSDFGSASALFGEALELATGIQALPRVCDAVFGLAQVADAQHDFERAVELYALVTEHKSASGDMQKLARERLNELAQAMA